MLAFIINEIVKLDPKASMRNIDVNQPAHRILGAAMVLDDAIQMITGVHDFNPLPATSGSQTRGQLLRALIENRFHVYSLLGGANRSRDLRLKFFAPRVYRVKYGLNILEYMIAVLMDNVWKFAAPATTVEVAITSRGEGLLDVAVTNVASPFPEKFAPFELGSKLVPTSKGFGYGLPWALILADRYSQNLEDGGPMLQLEHSEEVVSSDQARHTFAISCLRAIAED